MLQDKFFARLSKIVLRVPAILAVTGLSKIVLRVPARLTVGRIKQDLAKLSKI
jgi:hypothetical protein